MPIFENRLPKRGVFVIIFAARSGSTYLISLLNQHNNLLCYPEILKGKSHDEQRDLLEDMIKGNKVEQRSGRHRIWESCLNKTTKRPFFGLNPRFGNLDWVGLKVQFGQIRARAKFRAFAEENQIRVILLSRRNPVATAVSSLNAQRLKSKYDRHNANMATRVQGALHVQRDEFDQLLRERHRAKGKMDKYVGSFDVPVHRCFYEELLEDREGFLAGIFDFLEIPMEPVNYEDIIFKNTPKSLDQAILNYEEIRDSYKGTPFEKFFAAD